MTTDQRYYDGSYRHSASVTPKQALQAVDDLQTAVGILGSRMRDLEAALEQSERDRAALLAELKKERDRRAVVEEECGELHDRLDALEMEGIGGDQAVS